MDRDALFDESPFIKSNIVKYESFKACLVEERYLEGIDFHESFSPVVKSLFDANAPPRTRPLPLGPSFPSPRRADMLFKSCIGAFLHPQDFLYDLPFALSGNRTSHDRESYRHGFGSLNSPNPDVIQYQCPFCSYRESSRREIGTYEVTSYSPHGSPISEV
jgi:hypothetical protein